jgi:hypothetical protein
MSYLPAPYESPAQDDLSATLAAVLTTTVALITAWVLGQHVYPDISEWVDGLRGDLSAAQEQAFADSMQTAGVPTVGWSIAAVLLVIGALLLLFRRGRTLLMLGALISIAVTAWAQFVIGYGGEDAAIPVSQWWLYWGGVAVIALGLLPATGRWIGKSARVKPSTVIGTTETGAVLWPGM